MEEEVKRLKVNQNLSEEEKKSLAKEKYNIVFKPLLYVFEKVDEFLFATVPGPKVLELFTGVIFVIN
jgi:hypothetical protein